jgi:predicted Rossmann fold nucleotide-binding protein DprA/Smf involved in DNA uptake
MSLTPSGRLLLALASDIVSTRGDVRTPRKLNPTTWREWNEAAKRDGFPDIVALLTKATAKEWAATLNLDDTSTLWLENRLDRASRIAFALEELESAGIWVTTIEEPDYPRRYQQILKDDAPLVLYGAGNKENISRRGIAIVGSRTPDIAAESFTVELAQRLARDGLGIVSGGAKGVDRFAENAALGQGGTVVSILAEGILDHILKPDTRRNVIGGQLTILSEVNPRSRWFASTAMTRNRLIHALGYYSVVISARAGEGGTWAGAIQNLKNQWSPVLVRMEDGVPEGNLALVAQGAVPITREAITTEQDFQKWVRSQPRPAIVRAAAAPTPRPAPEKVANDVAKATLRRGEGDLFNHVWKKIAEALTHARSEDELAEHLNISRAQLREWLDRAIEEGRAQRDSSGEWRVLNFHAPRKDKRLDRFDE